MMKSYFMIKQGPMAGTVFLLENRLSIGRTPDNDIQLSDKKVSRQHAVAYLSDGQVIVEDLGSLNGTFVNGGLIKKTPLRSGDKLRVGSVELNFAQSENVPADTKTAGTMSTQRRMRIGEHLVLAGAVDEESLEKALQMQENDNRRIGQILMDMGVITDEQIASALASQLHIPLIRLKNLEIPKEATSLVSAQLVQSWMLMPIKVTGNKLLVAMADPLDVKVIQDLRFQIGMGIDVAVTPQSDINDAFNRHYVLKESWWG